MQDLWWVTALFTSFVLAMMVFANQVFKLKGSLVMIYRGIGTAAVLLPFVPLVKFVPNTTFWYLCISNGLLIALLDNRIFNASKIFGAELSVMLQPLSVVFEFFIWLLIVPAMLVNLLASPLKSIIILACLVCLAFSVSMVKKNRMSRKAFMYLLPAMLCVIIIDIQCKIMMSISDGNLIGTIFYYSMTTSLIAGSINAIAFFKQGNKWQEIFVPRNLIFAGIPIIVLMLLIYISKNCSLYLVENPAYTMAIINLYPIWATVASNIYSRYIKATHYTKPDKKILALIVVAVITLILIAQ